MVALWRLSPLEEHHHKWLLSHPTHAGLLHMPAGYHYFLQGWPVAWLSSSSHAHRGQAQGLSDPPIWAFWVHVKPLGLKGAAQTFQRLMDSLLRDLAFVSRLKGLNRHTGRRQSCVFSPGSLSGSPPSRTPVVSSQVQNSASQSGLDCLSPAVSAGGRYCRLLKPSVKDFFPGAPSGCFWGDGCVANTRGVSLSPSGSVSLGCGLHSQAFWCAFVPVSFWFWSRAINFNLTFFSAVFLHPTTVLHFWSICN